MPPCLRFFKSLCCALVLLAASPCGAAEPTHSVLVVAGDNYEEFPGFQHFIDPAMARILKESGWVVGECSWDELNLRVLERFDAVIFVQTPDCFIKSDRDARLGKMRDLLAAYLNKGGGVLIFPDLFRGTVHKTVNAWLEPYGIRSMPQTIRDRSGVVPFLAFPGFGSAHTEAILKDPITSGVGSFAYPIGNELATAFFPSDEWKVLVRGGATSYTAPSDGIEEKGETIRSAPPLVAVREAGKGRMAYWAGHSSFWILRPFHPYWDEGRLIKNGDGLALLKNVLAWLGSQSPKTVGGFQPSEQDSIYKHSRKTLSYQAQGQDLPGKPHKGLVGLQSEISGGGGQSVAALCAKAKEAGLDFVVFTEDAAAISNPAAWQKLVGECARETTATFIAFPGVVVESPETHDRAIAFNLRKPWPETPWDRGEFDCFVRIGVNNAWRPPFALLNPTEAPVPVANQGAVNALAVRTFDEASGQWKNADALFQRTQTELWGFSPLAYRSLRTPEEIAAALNGNGPLTYLYAEKWGTGFVMGQDEVTFSAVSDGPVLTVFNTGSDSLWRPPFSGHYRGHVRVERLAPADTLEVWFNKSLVRRYLPKNGVVDESFDFTREGGGSLFVRVLGGDQATRLQAGASRFAKLFSSYVGSDRMNGYWYPVQPVKDDDAQGRYIEGGYGLLRTTMYPQLGWGDHYLFRSKDQMESQPMGFEVGSPTGAIERMYAGFYVKRATGWETLAPWRSMSYVSSDAVVWKDEGIALRREPRLNGKRRIVVEPSPDIERTSSITGYRWGRDAVWLVQGRAEVKGMNVPHEQRVLSLRMGDLASRFSSVQVLHADHSVESPAVTEGRDVVLKPGDGMTLGDAPMGMVSVWALNELVVSIATEGNRPVINGALPKGAWPPAAGHAATARYFVVLSDHGQENTLSALQQRIFTSNRWQAMDSRPGYFASLWNRISEAWNPRSSKATPVDVLEDYRQSLRFPGAEGWGTWSFASKPWRASLAGFKRGCDLGLLTPEPGGWRWKQIAQSQGEAHVLVDQTPAGYAFLGQPVTADGLIVEVGALQPGDSQWTVTVHNPTARQVRTVLKIHPALTGNFSIADSGVEIAPGSTLSRTLAFK